MHGDLQNFQMLHKFPEVSKYEIFIKSLLSGLGYTKWTEGVNPVHFLPKTPNPIGFDQKPYSHPFF